MLSNAADRWEGLSSMAEDYPVTGLLFTLLRVFCISDIFTCAKDKLGVDRLELHFSF